MTATPAPTVTDRTDATEQEFRARIAPFEGAVTPPEVREAAVVEEVARALWDADGFPAEMWEGYEHGHHRTLAAAAIAAYRATQDGGAEEAVRRVEALCDAADDQPDGYECRFIATHVVRGAIAGTNR